MLKHFLEQMTPNAFTQQSTTKKSKSKYLLKDSYIYYYQLKTTHLLKLLKNM